MHHENLNLRRYIALLINQKVLILAATFLAAIIAFILTAIQSPVYNAEATIAVLRSRTEVEFDPRIRTLSDFELSNAGMSARQESLVALVRGNQVVNRILDDIGEHLDPEDRNIEDVRKMVETETAGDLVNINVEHEDPEVAALVANSWAEHYEQYVNSLYSSNAVVGSDIANQVLDAEQRYNEAQQALEAFTAEEQILPLQREITTRQALLQSYQQTVNQILVIPTDTSQALLVDYYRELQQIENWLAAANSLRDQVARDLASPAAEQGNAVALLMLRARIFSGEGSSIASTNNATENESGVDPPTTIPRESISGPDLTLQLDLSNAAESGVTTTDVDAVIEVLEQRREDAQGRIDALVEGINNGALANESSSAETEMLAHVSTLEDEIAVLQSEVEAQTARRRELEQARDRAWDTFQVLVGRQIEQEIISESPAAEVRIADTAIAPTKPVSRGLIRNTILAALVAMMLAIGAIIALDWWINGVPGNAEAVGSDSQDSDSSAIPERRVGSSSAPGHAGHLSENVS